MMEKVLEIARKEDAGFIQRMPDWNGKEVWSICFGEPGEEIACIGYPQYIICETGLPHLATLEEAMGYMKYLREKFQPEDEDDPGYEKGEPIVVA